MRPGGLSGTEPRTRKGRRRAGRCGGGFWRVPTGGSVMIDTCPECGAEAINERSGHIDFACLTVYYKDDGRVQESKQCLRNQLAPTPWTRVTETMPPERMACEVRKGDGLRRIRMWSPYGWQKVHSITTHGLCTPEAGHVEGRTTWHEWRPLQPAPPEEK